MTVQHRKLYSISHDNINWKRIRKRKKKYIYKKHNHISEINATL